MPVIKEYLENQWHGMRSTSSPEAQESNYQNALMRSEMMRQRERITQWRDGVSWLTNYATIDGELATYHRSALFVWKHHSENPKHRARNHLYLFNLKVYGHKVYTRRSKEDLAAAKADVARRVATGELGPLTLLEPWE